MKKFILSAITGLSILSALAQNTCPPNIDFSSGDLTNWQCYTGNVSGSNCSTNLVTVTPSTPVPLRHTVIAPTNATDPFGNFPMTPDNNPVVRLGYVGQTGAQAERISYSFTVPANAGEYTMTFKFALVHQNPSHCEKSQPHFSVKVFDSTSGQYISCASIEYFATPGTNGFQLSPVTTQGTVYYRPWTTASLILSQHAGHHLRMEITNADCTQGGHWAYSYFDFTSNCNAAIGTEICPTGTASVLAPYGFQSYSWWNSNFTQNLGNSQALNLATPPTSATSYYVDMIPFPGAGCHDTVQVNVQPTAGTPAPVITINGNVLTSSAATGNQWYLNGTAISGATSQTFTATTPGNYTAIVSANNCQSLPSNTVNFSTTSIQPLAREWKLQISPNPMQEKLVIHFDNQQKLDLQIFDPTGRLIMVKKNIYSGYLVDLTGQSAGMYMIRLNNTRTQKELRQMVVKL